MFTGAAGCIGGGLETDPNLPPAVVDPKPGQDDPPKTDPPKTDPPNTGPPDDNSNLPLDTWLAMEPAPWSLQYLSTEGDLIEVNLENKTEKPLISGKKIVEYVPNRDKDLIAYMTYNSPGEEEDVWLYYTRTSQTKHAFRSYMSSGMTWSPGGRYLMVDSGTDVFRRLSIFDTLTEKLRETVTFMGVLWSPTGCCIAVAMGKEVDPPLEIHDGRTLTVHLFDPANGESSLIAEGDRQHYWQPYLWDSNGLILKRDLWADYNSPQYFRYDTVTKTLTQIQKPGTPQPPTDLPQEIREIWSYQISPDRNYVLFQDYDFIEGVSMVKIWSRHTNGIYNIAVDHSPYWN
jgi:WD40 repeat protein